MRGVEGLPGDEVLVIGIRLQLGESVSVSNNKTQKGT